MPTVSPKLGVARGRPRSEPAVAATPTSLTTAIQVAAEGIATIHDGLKRCPRPRANIVRSVGSRRYVNLLLAHRPVRDPLLVQ